MELTHRTSQAERLLHALRIHPEGLTRGRVRDEPEYSVWRGAKRRCSATSGRIYENYAARGIDMCEEWKQNYHAFLEHIGRRPTPKHTLERIDNNRGYEPGNVRWATMREQIRNTRANHLVTYGGKTMTIVEWSEETGIPAAAIGLRLNRFGWDVDKALTLPPNKSQRTRAFTKRHKCDCGNCETCKARRRYWIKRGGDIPESAHVWPVGA